MVQKGKYHMIRSRCTGVGFCLLILISCGLFVSEPDNGDTDDPDSPLAPVGVYYYPWYADDFHGGAYLRERLLPPQQPVLGEYNDRSQEVVQQHLDWCREAGIGFWVASWWGPYSREDVTLLNNILPHPELSDFKIAVFYETTGLTHNFTDYTGVATHIRHLSDNYFSHANYLRFDGRPVLFIYLTRVLSYYGRLADFLATVRQTAAAEGDTLFIVGDQVFGMAPQSADNIALLDAVTNYDVYGSMGATGYATQAAVDAYYAAQSGWQSLAESVDVLFIPAATPGFNDRAVRSGHDPVSRQLEPDQPFGSLFRAMLRQARELTDPDYGGLLMITSWNEWHEDTQIEPVAIVPATSTDDSQSGTDYTDGLSYEGYGERYLEILREEMTPE
jgi:hypothetical protein